MKNEIQIHSKKDYRSFGLIVGSVLLLIFGLALPYWKSQQINLYFTIPGGVLILLALVFPMVLKYPYLLWMKIGEILGFINTRIILSIIFFVLFAPFGLVRRLIGRDSLGLQLHANDETYRKISTHVEIKHMERPF
jgi:hypothetical protein